MDIGIFPVFYILVASTGNVLAEGKVMKKFIHKVFLLCNLIIPLKCEKSVFKISKKY